MQSLLYTYNNLDRNNKILVILIIVIVFLIILIGIINLLNKISFKKQKKVIKENEKYLNEVSNKKEEIISITPIKEEVEEEIEVLDENQTDLDKLIDDLDSSKIDEVDLTEFEREQEESAIISYTELCKKAGTEKIDYNKKKSNTNLLKEEKANTSKYKPSMIISPIYGIQDNK